MCAGCKYEMTAKTTLITTAVYNKNNNSRSTINHPRTSTRCISEILVTSKNENTVYAQLYIKFFQNPFQTLR
jgi:hypothetical protein